MRLWTLFSDRLEYYPEFLVKLKAFVQKKIRVIINKAKFL